MIKEKDLVVINTYNRISALNETINSIKRDNPHIKICIVSKGKEEEKDLMHKVDFFHKVDNIGREAQGYLWAFLKYPQFKRYIFLQDSPTEAGHSFLGSEIKKSLEFMKKNPSADFVTSLPLSVTYSYIFLPRKIKNLKIDLNLVSTFLGIPSKNWRKWTIGACFACKEDVLSKISKKNLKKVLNLFEKREQLPWELEMLWLSLSKNPYILKNRKFKKISLNKLDLREYLILFKLKIIFFFKGIQLILENKFNASRTH